jgi:hypothetical protein
MTKSTNSISSTTTGEAVNKSADNLLGKTVSDSKIAEISTVEKKHSRPKKSMSKATMYSYGSAAFLVAYTLYAVYTI